MKMEMLRNWNPLAVLFLNPANSRGVSIEDWTSAVGWSFPERLPKVSAEVAICPDGHCICFKGKSISDLARGLSVNCTATNTFSMSVKGKCYPLETIIRYLKNKDRVLTLLSQTRERMQLTRLMKAAEELQCESEFDSCAALYRELAADARSLPNLKKLKKRLNDLKRQLYKLKTE